MIENLNTEFVEKYENITKLAILVWAVLGVILNIIIWANRKYASWIYPFETMYLVINSFTPINYGSSKYTVFLSIFFNQYIGYSINLGHNIVIGSLAYLFILLGPMTILYTDEHLTIGAVGQKLIMAFFLFMLLAIFAMLVTYIV